MLASAFQQISGQTQWPQRVHCPEELLAFLDSLTQGSVVGLAADGALISSVRIRGIPGPSAEDVAGGAQQTSRGSHHRVLERTSGGRCHTYRNGI